ncbi:branched-chain amino acid ABC transporter substrate-binding protein [Skermanella stibiiresistens SB22]|uniref:Branched-chain amino acid ABC transporter substrate-binding protein n=1 Tax=Skermanella stibiiresistens SB22 TaxID=1385369 RepID=W9GX93_9PROT|nr:ABC transporter substrate-binding protein [Skermanella stibiiresistens]EWY36103.1 branched-chain amino acid ABC transporter substrate-binding protein [Skermanella stibiiresistens SB22]
MKLSKTIITTGFACFLAAAGSSPTPAWAVDVAIGYLGQQEPPREPLSFIEPVLEDEGIQGAQLALKDNSTTGRLVGQNFTLDETIVPEGDDPLAAAREMLGRGVKLIVSDLPADTLLAVAALPEAGDALILNARAKDDSLRRGQCRANVLHTMPSHAMLADALGQYLVFKRWTRWFLVEGPGEGDKKLAEAIRRTAKRYNTRIVVDKPWTFETGNRRTDSGAVNERSEIQGFTQVDDYDILIVADEGDQFGEYLVDRTARPRPVAGTQGLVPTAWSRVTENWGGTQLQRRFERQAGRGMTERDHTVWLAVRTIGEAATRTNSGDPKTIEGFIRGPDFALGGFKGQPLSFRPWDGQMRQPILIANPRMLVSVSPQEGFLHQVTELDSLGDDRPETQCKF